MKLVVDLGACTGHGRCYALAPEVFAPDDDGHCVLVVEEVPATERDRARTAAQNCPEGAITLAD